MLPRLLALLDDPSAHLPKRIEAILTASATPPSLLHLFACDCAERALVLEGRLYGGSSFVDWSFSYALSTKRLWLEGHASDEEMIQARDAADQANLQGLSKHSSWAAAAAAGLSASSAALQASHECIRLAQEAAFFRVRFPSSPSRASLHPTEEYRWQADRLRDLLRSFLAERSHLLSLLSSRFSHLRASHLVWLEHAEASMF